MDYNPPSSLSMGFPTQEYWRRLPIPSPGDLPDAGMELKFSATPALQIDCLPLSYWRSPQQYYTEKKPQATKWCRQIWKALKELWLVGMVSKSHYCKAKMSQELEATICYFWFRTHIHHLSYGCYFTHPPPSVPQPDKTPTVGNSITMMKEKRGPRLHISHPFSSHSVSCQVTGVSFCVSSQRISHLCPVRRNGIFETASRATI